MHDAETPSARLHEAVRRISNLSAFSRETLVGIRTLNNIKQKPTDTGVENFARICEGLMREGIIRSADELLGLKAPDPSTLSAADALAARREVERIQAVALAAYSRLAKILPKASLEEPPPKR